MSVLTRAQRERGVALAHGEREARWGWGDWALSVAGPVGEDKGNNRALGKLQAGVEELAAHVDVHMGELPGMSSLRDYRAAADAIPSKLRRKVPTVYAGATLARVGDRRERHELIERLASEHPDGVVTVNAVRRAFNQVPTQSPPVRDDEPALPEHPDDKAELAGRLLEDPAVADKVVEGRTPASRNVKNAVHDQQLTDIHARAQQLDEEGLAAALPLPAYVARMIIRLTEFTHDLHRLHSHLDQLTDDEQRATIADKHRELIDKAERNVAALDPPPELPEDVIEGTSTTPTERTA